MKTACLLLLVCFAACNSNNDGNVPKPKNPADRTETEPKKDTNRLQGPPDSTNKLRGALLQKSDDAGLLPARMRLHGKKAPLLPAEHAILRS